MELRELFEQVISVIDELNIPNDLRAVAFEKGVDILAGPRSAPPAASSGVPDSGKTPPRDIAGARLEKIAAKLGTSIDEINVIYHEADDNLGIGVATSKLAKSSAAATREIALLIAAGRQAGGYDVDWTPIGEIRSVCSDYGRFDGANFASTITDMGDFLNFRGRGQGREVRVLKPGFDAAAALVRRLSTGAAG